MEDSLEDNITTRSLLKGILATEPVRTEVRHQSKRRVSQRPSSSYAHQDENSSSPSMNLRSKMKDRVRHSLGRSALEVSVLKRKVETNTKRKTRSAKKGSYPILEDLDKITPRTLLKKIIQNEDEVSIIVSQRSKSAIDDDRRTENTPTAKLSSLGNINLSLPDLQEPEHKTVFKKSRNKRKMRVSEFEREVDERLPKNRDYHTSQDKSDIPSVFVDSYSISRSENKLDISAPESTFKRGLLRRPNKMCLVSLGDFEQGVEDKYQQLKGSQECFIEPAEGSKSDSLSNEMAEMETELYAQSLRREGNASKSDRKQRGTSKLFVSTYDAIKEANNEFTEAETKKAKSPKQNTRRDIEGDHMEVGYGSNEVEINKIREEAGFENGEGKADSSSKYREPDDIENTAVDDIGEEVAADDSSGDGAADDSGEDGAADDSGEDGAADDIGEDGAADDIGEDGGANDSGEDGGANDSGEDGGAVDGNVEAADESGGEHRAADEVVDDDRGEDEVGEVHFLSNIQQNKSSLHKSSRKSTAISDYFHTLRRTRLSNANGSQAEESRHAVSVTRPEGSSVSTNESSDDENLVLAQRAIDFGMSKKKENNQLMLSPLPETPAYMKSVRFISTDKLAINKKIQRTKSTKPKPKKPASVFTSSQVKQIFNHHAKVRVAKEALADVEKCLDRYVDQLAEDLSSYTAHAKRKTITRADMELLMRRQRLVTDTTSLNVLIEKHLPLEYRKLLIPCARSGNQVVPKM
ncbi:centromere protein T isoform X2 [Engystomops pustulosus]|uniref:centromere protein T isoform X2 n=1 Tax=Engystomops pustulosus TaxID=76066 RepID=UPI003AFA6508